MSQLQRETDGHPPLPLAGGAVLVAGPVAGITDALARAASERGARVVLATPAQRDRVDDDRITPLRAGIRSETDADALIDSVVDLIPAMDTLIAVVAVEPIGEIHLMAAPDWRRQVTDPIRSVFWLVRRTVEEFLAAGVEGRIVLVAGPVPGAVGRNEIAEEALRAFTGSFAKEYGRRALSCNLVLTAPAAGHPIGPDSEKAIIESALFLASRAASFINGEAVVVDIVGPHPGVDPARRA